MGTCILKILVLGAQKELDAQIETGFKSDQVREFTRLFLVKPILERGYLYRYVDWWNTNFNMYISWKILEFCEELHQITDLPNVILEFMNTIIQETLPPSSAFLPKRGVQTHVHDDVKPVSIWTSNPLSS